MSGARIYIINTCTCAFNGLVTGRCAHNINILCNTSQTALVSSSV